MTYSDSVYNYSKSDLLLMVGGQIAFLLIAILVLLFGVRPIQFEYAKEMRNMLSTPQTSNAQTSNVKP